MEAQILEAIGIDFIDESEVLTPADETHHINKHNFKVPVLCGCRDLGEALRRIAEARTPARARAAPPQPLLALPPGHAPRHCSLPNPHPHQLPYSFRRPSAARPAAARAAP